MKPLKPKRLALIVIVMMVAGVVVWQLFTNLTAAELLTEQQARIKVENLYKGRVVKVQEDDDVFVFELELETGNFEVEINRETGEIGSLTKLDHQISKQLDDKESPTPQPMDTHPPSTDPQTHLISEEDAKEIALQQISGTIDEFETNEIDGVVYYFVEVERDDGEEGTVQIHGITGEVVSISWDD